MNIGSYVAVCCPGPSLAKFHECSREWSAVIAVNRAVLAVPATHWAYLDTRMGCATWPEVYEASKTGKGIPVIVTRPTAYHECGRQAPAFRDNTTMIDIRQAVRTNALLFSSVAAMKFAISLEPQALHMFGMDMVGKADWDGTVDPENNRAEKRWEAERAIISEIVGEAMAAGIDVVRGVGRPVGVVPAGGFMREIGIGGTLGCANA